MVKGMFLEKFLAPHAGALTRKWMMIRVAYVKKNGFWLRCCERSLFVLSSMILVWLISCTGKSGYPEPQVKNGEVVIDVRSLEPETPEFYSYHHKGKKINFFLIKTNDIIYSFFDACKTCYPKKLGFRHDRGRIICKSCNEGYPLSIITTGVGGCYPIMLGGQMKDGEYHIPLAALQAMRNKF